MSDIRVKAQEQYNVWTSVCTFCGEGRCAVLDSIELQEQPVQLRQVAAQG